LTKKKKANEGESMARKLRLEYAGACYHIINRGNYRRNLFTGEGAAESFLKCLYEACLEFGLRVIMSNHFHLALETPEPNLSDGMRWLQGTWAQRFNRFRGEVGRPFQGRYKALHVERGYSLAQVIHYIHLNPVRAKLVTADRLLSYRWSSLPLYVTRNRPAFLDGGVILEDLELPDTAAGWRRYVAYLSVQAEEDKQKRKERYGRFSCGWVIGSAEFKAGLREEFKRQSALEERFGLLGGDREAHRQLRAELWEDQLQAAAKHFRIKLQGLPAAKSALEKVKLAAVMKTCTSASNGWLAQRLQMGQPASVSQFVRRFRLAGSADQRDFQRTLSTVKP
jgi:REP element-mobilizing transposase RayT